MRWVLLFRFEAWVSMVDLRSFLVMRWHCRSISWRTGATLPLRRGILRRPSPLCRNAIGKHGALLGSDDSRGRPFRLALCVRNLWWHRCCADRDVFCHGPICFPSSKTSRPARSLRNPHRSCGRARTSPRRRTPAVTGAVARARAEIGPAGARGANEFQRRDRSCAGLQGRARRRNGTSLRSTECAELAAKRSTGGA